MSYSNVTHFQCYFLSYFFESQSGSYSKAVKMKVLVVLISIFCLHSQAQDLAITSGYSSSERSFLLDLGSGSLSPAGDQDWEPNLTFMAVSQDGKAIYASHEVTEYGSFGQTGAVSRWLKGRDPMGKPIFGKFEVIY